MNYLFSLLNNVDRFFPLEFDEELLAGKRFNKTEINLAGYCIASTIGRLVCFEEDLTIFCGSLVFLSF